MVKSNRSSKAFKVEKFDFIYLNCFPGNSYFRDYGSVVERCIGNAEVAGSIPASRLEFHPLRGE